MTDTIDFVRHWLMSGDEPVTNWEREFAAAIDARDSLARQQTGGGEEWVTISARDGIEAQHGLNDIFPGDPVQVKASRLLADVDLTLRHARTFITSRQKMHPDGITLYDEQIEAVSAALSGEGRNGG